MTDYNEFNWNEDEPQIIEAQNKSVYTESVLKPKSAKKKKSGKGKLVAGIICGAVAGSMLSTTLVLSLFQVSPNNNTVTIYESGVKKTSAETTLVSSVVTDNTQELTIPEIAQRVGPAVVGISCTVTYTTSYGFFSGTQQGTSSGSGIVISDSGHIVTNYHVIEDAQDITVKFNDGEECAATLVGGDEETDIAVLKIDPVDNMCVATLGDSDLVEVGDLAVAIGNPLGDELFGTVTSGIISGKNRTVEVDGREMTLLQTDAAINPGNSGGALINKYGEIIGINSVKIASSYSGTTSEGLGFAIPINEVKSIVSDLITYGYVKGRPLIGVTVQQITTEIAYYNNLPVDHGLYVMGVTEGAAADLAGIQRGDIILAIDGTQVKTSSELNEIRDQHSAGDVVELEIDRNGQRMTVPVTLTEDSSAKIN